jgi:hypothetical protein
MKKTRPTSGLPVLVGGAVIALVLAISITAPQSQENNDPRTEPIPTFDVDDPSKATVVDVTFNGPDDVQVNSISVVRQRPPGAGGNPPLLRVEVVNQAGTVLLQFNEWNPLHTRVYDDEGHSHQIADTASMPIPFPFDRNHSFLRIHDLERGGVQLLEVDLRPVIDEFCRANPRDPDCDIARRR